MPDPEKSIHQATAKAIQLAAKELREKNATGRLFGFALCTDDDVRTLYHVACTADWVQAKETSYPDVGYIYVEWPDSASGEAFNKISEQLAELADQEDEDDEALLAARNRRFDAMVLALVDCRKVKIFDPETLLCVASTDPGPDLEEMTMRAVEKLNLPNVVDEFARALGYEHHRTEE